MDWFKIGEGVRQGCILLPCLFNFYAEYIMWNARLDEAQAGIKIARRNINNLRYADDTMPGASVRNSAHGKGHEERGLAYAKTWSSLRTPRVPEHLTPKPESVLCSHLHLWLYGGLSPITVSLGEGINVQLQGNKNSWAWQECFSLQTPLKVI